jgi:hypothetical protein
VLLTVLCQANAKDERLFINEYMFYFLAALPFLPFFLVLMYRIEVKNDSFKKFNNNIARDVKMVNPQTASILDNDKVILVTGDCYNPLALVDEEFSVFAQNCYRLVRTVEQY